MLHVVYGRRYINKILCDLFHRVRTDFMEHFIEWLEYVDRVHIHYSNFLCYYLVEAYYNTTTQL